MSDVACAMADVRVVLSRRPVLDGVSVSVQCGEFAVLVGPNGSGKTTFLRLVNATLLPSSGEVRVFGVRTTGLGEGQRAALRRDVATVPQLVQPPPDAAPIRVNDVVLMGRSGRRGLLRRHSPEDRATAAAWMERLGILDLRDRLYSELSGGEQRKVHLARALAQEPRMLLLDEPTSHLDPLWQQEAVGVVEGVWRRGGLTVVLVTHDISRLPSAVGRVVQLARGRVASDGPLEGGFGAPGLRAEGDGNA